MTDPFDEPPRINRDRWGRPLVIPVGGGKPVPYTRCTTYIKALEDTYNLERWGNRMVALGLADCPDLLLSVAAHRDDKDKLNEICDQAREAAKASAPGNIGTALHRLCERLDRGETLGIIPAQFRPDLDAYVAATGNLEPVAIEQFMVQDVLKIGGTPDRMIAFKKGHRPTRINKDKPLVINDIKTGNIQFGAGAIAMQLAVYARSKTYDIKTGERTGHPDLNLDWAIVTHLPAGQGACELHWVDIRAGWSAVLLARQVRDWRKRKDLITEWEDQTDAAVAGLPDEIEHLINGATSIDELTGIWRANTPQWDDHYTSLAAARKTQLLTQEKKAS